MVWEVDIKVSGLTSQTFHITKYIVMFASWSEAIGSDSWEVWQITSTVISG